MSSLRREAADSTPLLRHPLYPATLLARAAEIPVSRAALISTFPGRLAFAAYVRRRAPARTIKARAAAGRASRLLISGPPRAYRAGALVGVGPGEREDLAELIDSIRLYEGDDVKIVVADDLTGEYPNAVARRDFPDVDFVRPRIASGTSYSAFRALQPALLHLTTTYRVPAVLKCDPDALIIRSGGFDIALERFRSQPQIGMLGSAVFGTSVKPPDPRWVTWFAQTEIRWSPRFRHLVRAARRAVPRLNLAQAGACFLSGQALDAAIKRGLLPYRQPHWSLQCDDVMFGLFVQAAGFTVESFGKRDPIASDARRLPYDPPELLQRGFAIVHSVRGSPSGMAEADIREFFTARRGQSTKPRSIAGMQDVVTPSRPPSP